MKRILNVIHTMNPETGGPCQGIRNIIPALSELGIVSEVVCCDDPQADYISADPFKIHALGTSKGYWKYNSQLFHWLQNNITRFDIILVRGLWLYHSYAVIEVIRQLKKQGKNTRVLPHSQKPSPLTPFTFPQGNKAASSRSSPSKFIPLWLRGLFLKTQSSKILWDQSMVQWLSVLRPRIASAFCLL